MFATIRRYEAVDQSRTNELVNLGGVWALERLQSRDGAPRRAQEAPHQQGFPEWAVLGSNQ